MTPFQKMINYLDPNLHPFLLSLPIEKQKKVLSQIESLPESLLNQLRKTIDQTKTPLGFEAYNEARPIEENFREQGNVALHRGKVACLLVAGGQGTRLGFKGPKGCFPLSNTTLFQLFAEKVVKASQHFGKRLPIAIMTSPLNDKETKAHFLKNDDFGLHREQLDFFSQGLLPFLNTKGELFLETEDQIAMGPNGNGASLQALVQSGITTKWLKQGIETVVFVMIDNPLADPFDPLLVGAHLKGGQEVTIKAIERKIIQEKMGLLVSSKGKLKVIEYSEFPQDEWEATLNGKPKHAVANISLFAFSLNFIEKISSKQLPFHKAFKACPHLDPSGKQFPAAEPFAWKFEHFIFDVLNFTTDSKTYLYPREKVFAPLKSLDCMEEVLKAIQPL